MKEKSKDKTISLAVTNDLIVRVIPNENHEFLMTTKQVAAGYEANYEAVKKAKQRYPKELIEGIHYVPYGTICPDGKKPANNANLFWTKAGIIRLGFFLKSERAKLFRDWTERLILRLDKQYDLFGNTIEPKQPKRVRTAPQKAIIDNALMSIISDICEIEDKVLRMRIIQKISTKIAGEGVIL